MAEICKLNNEAAFCIQNKEYNRSIGLLHKAAKQIRETMINTNSSAVSSTNLKESAHQESQSCSTDNGSNLCRFLAVSSKSDLDSCFLKMKRPSSSSTTTKERDSPSFPHYTMFASPIVFNHIVSLLDPLAFERVSYALVYNLALAHHCLAIQCESDNEASIASTSYCSSSSSSEQPHRQAQHHHVALQQKALILYEKSFSLLVRASEGWNVSVLHSLSILCNLGHLHHIMGSEDKSAICYQNLLSTICCVLDSRGGMNSISPNNDHAVSEILLDGFFLNVMHLLQKGSVAAAA